jgi:hypothetical protein
MASIVGIDLETHLAVIMVDEWNLAPCRSAIPTPRVHAHPAV